VADAAHAIFLRRARDTTGRFFIDEEVLASEGVTDFGAYALAPDEALLPDLFL
jgi:citronellol/citronellal dehydrogenase